MKFLYTEIKGAILIQNTSLEDVRGGFLKVFNKNAFNSYQMHPQFCEIYYSISKKNVIRGMHFQVPPYAHDKLVHIIRGSALDVILDIRANSDTYGKYFSMELSETKKNSLYIPAGCAHGFKAIENDTIMLYGVTSAYDSNFDSGIRYDSFGFDWNVENPILSEKDKSMVGFTDFITPF